MTSNRAKVGSPKLDKETLEVIRKAEMPVSIQYVANHVNVAWHQARSQLFKLAMEGKIKAVDTTKSWVFYLGEEISVPKGTVAIPLARHSHSGAVVESLKRETKQ
ncbi:unnamed protein product [marine sediment metagenome]|uniref:Uncharacterized protein n=1 Tax=marine sediment metagenome TaxID=412755 RepID=X1M613_9ZZZZ